MHFNSVAFLIFGIAHVESSLKRKADDEIQPTGNPDETPEPVANQPRPVVRIPTVEGFVNHMRAPKALLPILINDADFRGKLALSGPLLGNTYSMHPLLRHWMQFCGLGLQIHALKPLDRAPCEVIGEELVMSDRMLQFILGRVTAAMGGQPQLRRARYDKASWSADRTTFEILAEFPFASFQDIKQKSKGKVGSPEHVDQLRELFNASIQIPFGLYQVFVKAHFAPSWETAVEVQQALDRYTSQRKGWSLPNEAQLAVWREMCLDSLYEWFTHPVSEIPCYFDQTGDFMILAASKRRSLVSMVA